MNKGVKDIEFTTSWSKMTKVGGQSIKDVVIDQDVSTTTRDQEKTYRILLMVPYGNIPAYWFPLALGYLKNNIPERHHVEILDCTLAEMPSDSPELIEEFKKFNPDIVGISTASLTSSEAINALKVAKSVKPSVITVLGGSHGTNYPDKVMKNEFIDYCFRGESDLSFDIFLNQLTAGNFDLVAGLVYRKKDSLIKNEIKNEDDIDKIKIPDYHALKLKTYLDRGYNYGGFYGKTAPIWVTRGCPFKCSFCSAPLLNGRGIRAHSPEYLANWIEYLYNEFEIRQFSIIDDNFTFDMDYAKSFCRFVIQRVENGWFDEQIYFTTPNGVRMEMLDDELLALMKKAGWEGLTLAPESGSKKTLVRMKKNTDITMVPGIVEMVRAAGLNVRAFFMVGYPGETLEDVKDTIKLIRSCKLDSILIGRFVPLPGTPIYDELVELGEIPADYIPPQTFSLFTPFQERTRHKIYNPPGFESFNLFWTLLREHIFLALRNPRAILYFVKYYGVMNVMKKMFFLGKPTGEKLGSAYTNEKVSGAMGNS
jgi:radical SAM superfamily enzyme YgiQ (UPF0313 family)